MARGSIGPVTTATTAGGGIGGALALVIVWVAGLCGLVIPPEVAVAIATLIMLCANLLGGKLVPPPESGRHAAPTEEVAEEVIEEVTEEVIPVSTELGD